MTTRTFSDIVNIALEVRDACEDYCVSPRAYELNLDYYNDPEFLSGMCATASFALYEELVEFGIPKSHLRLVLGTFHNCGGRHVWLEYQNSRIIDITATQFNGWFGGWGDEMEDPWDKLKKVHITKIDNQYYLNRRKVKGYKTFNCWISGQRPTEIVVKEIRELLRNKRCSYGESKMKAAPARIPQTASFSGW